MKNKMIGSIIVRLLKKTRAFNNILLSMFEKPKRDVKLNTWKNSRGDQTFRLEYDLNQNSLVFDIGGYEGQWTSDIFSMYLCYIYVFEPVLDFANKIEKRFSKNKKIKVFKFGLGNKTKKMRIFINKDSSSFFKRMDMYKEAKIVCISDFLKENNINEIDLVKINIEGGEYNLLEDLINSGYIQKIKDIQVQFHNFTPNSEIRMKKIQAKLRETHYLTYQYYLIWENWRIKVDNKEKLKD